MNRLWKKQLKGLYQTPEPQRKTAFLQELNYPKATLREFVLTQAGYIRNYVWILSVVLVCGAVMIGTQMPNDMEIFPMLYCLSAIMPVLALLLVLETSRSEMYGMDELEQTAKHNLPEVLLVRMGSVAAVDFILVGMAVPAVVRYDGLGVFRVAVYLLVPYLSTCFLALGIQRRKRGRESVWYSIVASVFICMLMLFSQLWKGMLYEEKKFLFWVIALLLLGVMLVIQIKEMRKNREEYRWNLYLTE